MKLREYVTTTPTVGFNVETVEYENIDVTVRDVVGQDQIRLLWAHYYQNVQGFIFVIDTNDRDRIEDTHEELSTNEHARKEKSKEFRDADLGDRRARGPAW